ncbi:Aromatic-L-amino-acid decarboxylase [Armadillidium nasatum]|uniref:Aromatic-L-amino-acid decarboxylase n=1 Tax=Armadillidium nasatum TaxID=96803 RepID=A0A5N5SUF6_9CRUS|nr:Aromatic-L-amino-acid decarboxylase [Armadillidium nasatum]
MDGEEFKKASAELSEYIVNYLNNIRERRVLSNVTHWSSPRFHAFYATGNSYPGILADMLTGGIGCIGFTWMSASDSIFVMLLTAKKKKLLQLGKSETSDPIVSKFIVYSSEESHSAVFRAAVLGGVKYRSVPSDENYSLRTTFSCSFDNLREIGEVCNEFNLWCHVDAAYAGAAFVCEEYQYLMDGIELMDSFNFNPHKWIRLKNSLDLVNTCNVDLILLRHEHEQKVPDYRHWQIPLGRRFRSLKLWFIALAKEFESYVRKDERFEIFGEVILGLVCFRLKGSNELNKKFLEVINSGGSIYLVPAEVKSVYFLSD